MPTTFATIQEDIARETAAATSPNFKVVLGFLGVIAEEVARIKLPPPPDPQPIPDLVTTLRIEIEELKRRLAMQDDLARIVEDTRTALRQREEADAADQTAVRLPAYAAKLMAELDKCRKG